MRAQIIAAFATISAVAAVAQPAPQRPAEPAPQPTASIEQREAWCQRYTGWVVTHMPAEAPAQPSDVRPTHRAEVELSSCALDPQEYERVTIAEVSRNMTRERRAEG